ncbi:MAG TPA: TonB family protein [Terrimicrobiaceae bacterium]|nr:TonB family protein [Terrimicrobiaceae bacterium]
MSCATLTIWREDERRKALVALAASILLHLFIIGSVSFMLAVRKPISIPPPEEAPVELTLVAAPDSTPKPQPVYVQTSESQRADKPPEPSVFESDKDTHAASPLPAAGDAPVPTQEGRDQPGLSLENKEYTAGPVPRESSPAVQPRQETAPEPKAEESKPKMTPQQSTQLALLEPPKPKTSPRPKAAKAVRKEQQQQAQTPQPPGYQPQTRITRIRGNISNKGRAAVSATATPLGRYKKMLSDAIGSRWYYYVTEQLGLLNVGTVEVRFLVRENGNVERVQVLRNSSNESFAACTVRAIMEADIPPIPKELVPMLEGSRIEIEYSFTILSN